MFRVEKGTITRNTEHSNFAVHSKTYKVQYEYNAATQLIPANTGTALLEKGGEQTAKTDEVARHLPPDSDSLVT
jgi:hypothetical protein